MPLILKQQKMINELITKLEHTNHVNKEDEDGNPLNKIVTPSISSQRCHFYC